MALFDALMPYLVEPYINSLLPQLSGVFFGACRRTRVLDITHGLSAGIEKGLDLRSALAIGQHDVQQY